MYTMYSSSLLEVQQRSTNLQLSHAGYFHEFNRHVICIVGFVSGSTAQVSFGQGWTKLGGLIIRSLGNPFRSVAEVSFAHVRRLRSSKLGEIEGSAGFTWKNSTIRPGLLPQWVPRTRGFNRPKNCGIAVSNDLPAWDTDVGIFSAQLQHICLGLSQ